jgi:hypothetical protein
LRGQLPKDRKLSERDVVAMLPDRLRYEDVISQDFDAYAWVPKILQEQHLSPGEPLQRAARMVQAWIRYWQTHSGCEAEVSVRNAPDKNFNYEAELVSPVEPVLNQFGMNLDDETDHTGEHFLPFDT